MITQMPHRKNEDKRNELALAIYDTLRTHASTLINKVDARICSDLLAVYFKYIETEEIIDRIITGIYQSDLTYKHPMNIALLSKFIRSKKVS